VVGFVLRDSTGRAVNTREITAGKIAVVSYSHVLKVFLVDRAGDIRNIYSAGFLVPDLVVNDIKTVLAGPARP